HRDARDPHGVDRGRRGVRARDHRPRRRGHHLRGRALGVARPRGVRQLGRAPHVWRGPPARVGAPQNPPGRPDRVPPPLPPPAPRGARTPAQVVAILSGFGIVLTEAMSHSAVVALLMPVALGIAQKYGMDPRVMAPVVALPSGLAFTLPVGTPGNAIAYSSGY